MTRSLRRLRIVRFSLRQGFLAPLYRQARIERSLVARNGIALRLRGRVAWRPCGRFWSPHISAFDETEQIDHKRLGDGAGDCLR